MPETKRISAARRAVWFLLLPLFVLNAVVWLLGVCLERLGDAMQQGADALRDELTRWGRVLFSVSDAPAATRPIPDSSTGSV